MSANQYRGKRAFDVIGVAVVALFSAPIALLCALAVRLTSRGPVVFRQDRSGLSGRVFVIFKFRTMVGEDDPSLPEERRITRVGRVLRRFSLDELPQLWNVAVGDMSLVGPRPTLPYQVERYDDRQRRRLAIKPGLTGLAQVLGRRSLTWAQRIECDLTYMEAQSPYLDLKILLLTLIAVLRPGGGEGHPADDPLAVRL